MHKEPMSRMTMFIVGTLAIIAIFGVTLAYMRGDEDDWVCVHNRWEQHGEPFTPEPTEPCGTSKTSLIRVDLPQPMDHVRSPLIIRGRAGEDWFSTRGIYMALVDWDDYIIAEGYLEKGAPAADGLYAFDTTLRFKKPADATRGTLILQKSIHPRDRGSNGLLEIPVFFK